MSQIERSFESRNVTENLCTNCNAKLPTMARRLAHVNVALWQLGLTYHKTLPIHAIDSALTAHGFVSTAVWTFCPGGEVKLHEPVGDGKWLSVSAHKMESGNWEVVAYVN